MGDDEATCLLLFMGNFEDVEQNSDSKNDA